MRVGGNRLLADWVLAQGRLIKVRRPNSKNDAKPMNGRSESISGKDVEKYKQRRTWIRGWRGRSQESDRDQMPTTGHRRIRWKNANAKI